jgi:hypothetical protein
MIGNIISGIVNIMSRKYLNWVKELDCCMCGAPADDPHHVKGIGNFSGMGMKAPDYLSMPLCRGCHNQIHNDPDLWANQWEWIVRTLHRAFKEGKVNFTYDESHDHDTIGTDWKATAEMLREKNAKLREENAKLREENERLRAAIAECLWDAEL